MGHSYTWNTPTETIDWVTHHGSRTSLPLVYPYTTVYITPPLGRFSILDISTVGIEPVPKRSALETSR